MNKRDKLIKIISEYKDIHKCERFIFATQVINDPDEMIRCRESDLDYLNKLLYSCENETHIKNVTKQINKHTVMLEITRKYKEMIK